jgi:general secretion pathway protein K
MLGIQPVAFQSESDFAKSITTESKIFSMYAVGVVKGYKRETRLSIHEVVDFRTAPVVSAAPTASGSAPLGGLGVTAPPPTAVASASSSADPNSIAAAMQPSTGGQVIYYHLE